MLKPKIFISYKRKHQPTLHAIETIEAALRAANFDILRDTNMEPGERWSNELYAWLLECSGAIAIIGEEAAKSEWCRREWWFLRERHHSSGLPVIPICLGDEVESAGILDDLQALFFGTNAGDDIVSRLSAVRAIKASAKDYLAAHHSWLRWQFTEAPVLGREPFSLSEVYVETECGDLSWRQIADDKPLDPFVDEEEHGGRKPLVEAVMSLVCDAQYREPIIVQGSPGSGKSAFTLKLANELLKQDLKPLLVRFRDLRLTTFDSVDELLEDGLRIGPVEEEPPRPDGSIISETLNVLKRGAKASIPQLVVILDGWDEVSLTGNTSYKAQLQSWLPKIREYFVERPGPAVRLVLTGRPSVEVRASGVLKRDTRVLTVRHMSPSQLKGFADRISKLLASRKKADSDTGWTLDLQRLQGVFGQYDSWFKRDSNRRKGGESFDVIGNPLLALLTFRTLADWKGDPSDLIKKPTALYHALVDATVQHAGKGKDDDLRDTVHRGGEALRRLLQKVASVISILGREAVSFAELKYRLDEDPSLAEWCRDLSRSVSDAAKENALYELVVNFYFKGGNTGLGCEFLHKSFREYLFAEAIVETLKTLSSDQADRGATAQTIQYWQDFPDGSPQFAASRQLSSLLAPQWLRTEVRDHVFWLIDQAVSLEPVRWARICGRLLDIYIWWAEGVHLRPQPVTSRGQRNWSRLLTEEMLINALPFDPGVLAEPMRSVTLDAHLGDALMQMTAFLHTRVGAQGVPLEQASGLRAKYRVATKRSQKFVPGGGAFFKSLCARINAAGWRPDGEFPMRAFLQGCYFNSERLIQTNWYGAELSEAVFDESLTSLNVFLEANLEAASFVNTSLFGTLFGSARLTRADMRGADCKRAYLGNANLEQAVLANAKLDAADLSGANCKRSLMTDAHLEGADLSDANLEGADMRGAELKGAKIKGANLDGVKFEGARSASVLRRAAAGAKPKKK